MTWSSVMHKVSVHTECETGAGAVLPQALFEVEADSKPADAQGEFASTPAVIIP